MRRSTNLTVSMGHETSSDTKGDISGDTTSGTARKWPPTQAPAQQTPAEEHAAATQSEEAAPRRKPGPRPGSPEARVGGCAVRDMYGIEFYRSIGRRGGATVRDRHGAGFFSEIGRRGGEATKLHLGAEHYARIGRRGGTARRRAREDEAPTEERDVRTPQRKGTHRDVSRDVSHDVSPAAVNGKTDATRLSKQDAPQTARRRQGAPDGKRLDRGR
jgi:uncharacterized protein